MLKWVWMGLLIPVMGFAQANVTLSIPDTSVTVGETVWVPFVTTDLDTGYSAYQLTIIYPSDLVRVVGISLVSVVGIDTSYGLLQQITCCSFSTNFSKSDSTVLTPGELRVIGASWGETVTGSGPLFYVGFEPLFIPDGSKITLTPGPVDLYAFPEIAELPTFISGVLTVSNPDYIVSVRNSDQGLPEELSIYAAPNPFNSRLVITALISGATPGISTTVTIWSLLGQPVRRWTVSENASGGKIVWDGRDASGRASGSGKYVVELLHGQMRKSIGVSLVR